MSSFYPYAKQSITEEDISEVVKSLKSPAITRGPKVEEFEHAIANYCGADYAVAFNNATSALIASCHVVNINKFDRIITSPNTFIATIAGGWNKNAEPLFIDIEARSGNIDVNLLEENLNYSSIQGRNIIMPVHFAGIPVDMKKIEGMIKDPNTVVIEDAAHALGSSYPDGQKVGCCAWSDMTVFSFHPAKNITTGEGGMVLTNSSDLQFRLKQFRNNGIYRFDDRVDDVTEIKDYFPGSYEVREVTGNYHMTDFQAALGLSQLTRLDDYAKKRRLLVSQYKKELSHEKGIKFLFVKNEMHVMYHLCVVKIDFAYYKKSRQYVMNKLNEKGIGTQVHYIPLYRHPFFTDSHKDIKEYFPNMEEYYTQALTLPLYTDLTVQDVKRITSELKKILRTNAS